jgi:hypothetical protein
MLKVEAIQNSAFAGPLMILLNLIMVVALSAAILYRSTKMEISVGRHDEKKRLESELRVSEGNASTADAAPEAHHNSLKEVKARSRAATGSPNRRRFHLPFAGLLKRAQAQQARAKGEPGVEEGGQNDSALVDLGLGLGGAGEMHGEMFTNPLAAQAGHSTKGQVPVSTKDSVI